MPGTIDVDTTNETATLTFVDDKGNETPVPAGATVTFTSSDESVATVTSDPSNPTTGSISPVGVGSADISVSVDGANEPDGSPIPAPDAVTLTVNPGAAAGERLTVGPN